MDVVEAMLKLGFNRPTAVVYNYMLKHPDGYEIDIEHKTGLRQPEVSIAIRELLHRDWIILDPRRVHNSRGRPRNYYYFSKEKAAEDIKKLIDAKIGELKDIRSIWK